MTPKELAEMHKRMEWQKAKGHLMSMLETFHSDGSPAQQSSFEWMHTRVKDFIKEVEDEL